MVEIEFSSKTLISLVEKIKEFDNGEKSNGLLNRIKQVIDMVKERMIDIMHRFSGIIAHLCTFVSDSLKQLKNSIDKGIDKIIGAIYTLSRYILELAESLTGEMFKFFVRFRSLANSKGFDLSRMEVKVPSIGFESLSMAGFTIPFPKIQSPEILMIVESGK